MSLKHKSLSETLLEEKVLTDDQMKKIKQETNRTGESLRHLLIKQGLMREDELTQFIADHFDIPSVDLSTYLIDSAVLTKVPEAFARKYHVVPLFKINEMLTVAMSDPLDVVALDELRLKTGHIIEPVIAKESDIQKAITQYYRASSSIDDLLDSPDVLEVTKDEEDALTSQKLMEMAEEAPVVKLVNLLILKALEQRASDIHIEPEEELLRVRIRVDGVLREMTQIPKPMQPAVISRVKIMADLDISQKRVPQDGRIQIRTESTQVDIRVSTMPSNYGENVVMRLLDATSVLLGLEQMGFTKEILQNFRELIRRPYGIILVTGPTGSGKSTTLYAALNTINSEDKNIITLEDPIEYRLTMIRQTQVNPLAGLTFALGLRAILRQDPDVVMVGEIRDQETAEIAVQAALTGHLVFSTLHTNDAPGALTRLTDMGVEPFLIASATAGVLAQRLVRKICPNCRQPYRPGDALLTELEIPRREDLKFYRGKGCSQCHELGYQGRTGLFELMLVDDKVRELVLAKESTAAIKRAAQEGGMVTLRQDGLTKAAAGITSVEEVIRATALDR